MAVVAFPPLSVNGEKTLWDGDNIVVNGVVHVS
jgi:hypothetical protein